MENNPSNFDIQQATLLELHVPDAVSLGIDKSPSYVKAMALAGGASIVPSHGSWIAPSGKVITEGGHIHKFWVEHSKVCAVLQYLRKVGETLCERGEQCVLITSTPGATGLVTTVRPSPRSI